MSDNTFTMKKSKLTEEEIETIFRERKLGGREFRISKVKFSDKNHLIEIKEDYIKEENVSDRNPESIEKTDKSEDKGGERKIQ